MELLPHSSGLLCPMVSQSPVAFRGVHDISGLGPSPRLEVSEMHIAAKQKAPCIGGDECFGHHNNGQSWAEGALQARLSCVVDSATRNDYRHADAGILVSRRSCLAVACSQSGKEGTQLGLSQKMAEVDGEIVVPSTWGFVAALTCCAATCLKSFISQAQPMRFTRCFVHLYDSEVLGLAESCFTSLICGLAGSMGDPKLMGAIMAGQGWRPILIGVIREYTGGM